MLNVGPAKCFGRLWDIFFLILMYFKVVEEYNRREQEIKHLEKELEEKSNNLSTYRQKITEVWSLLGWAVESPRNCGAFCHIICFIFVCACLPG